MYDAVGTVRARVSATVSSKLMGTIQAFTVKEGDLVKSGDLLVQLDERQVSAQLNQAQAALAEARKAETGRYPPRQRPKPALNGRCCPIAVTGRC